MLMANSGSPFFNRSQQEILGMNNKSMTQNEFIKAKQYGYIAYIFRGGFRGFGNNGSGEAS